MKNIVTEDSCRKTQKIMQEQYKMLNEKINVVNESQKEIKQDMNSIKEDMNLNFNKVFDLIRNLAEKKVDKIEYNKFKEHIEENVTETSKDINETKDKWLYALIAFLISVIGFLLIHFFRIYTN